jgi:hypothetical protein
MRTRRVQVPGYGTGASQEPRVGRALGALALEAGPRREALWRPYMGVDRSLR